MKRLLFYTGILFIATRTFGQTPPDVVQRIFSPETVVYPNIHYADDTSRKHLLDIYLPAGARKNTPLVVMANCQIY
ncbi:MAG TPA: hypothetical protein VHC96_19010 [Puia sp.]|jgi:hypothetical protein|nr:hypothetical protein [Puia sp.]